MDSNCNFAFITRKMWMSKGRKVYDGMQYGCFGGVPSQYGCRTYGELDKVLDQLNIPEPSYHYEDIEWAYGEPYIENISENFNKDDELRIIGELASEVG